MSGAINFSMTDIYGGFFGTTETTIPEAADQTALVDDQKAATDISSDSKKKVPIAMTLVLLVIIAIIAGGVK